jgi:hypothetical protein
VIVIEKVRMIETMLHNCDEDNECELCGYACMYCLKKQHIEEGLESNWGGLCPYCFNGVDYGDSEWIDVYHEQPFPNDMPVQDDKGITTFQNYTYYQCWGGGPEGGYLMPTYGEGIIIKINRTWGEHYKVIERLDNFQIIYRDEYQVKGITKAIMIVGL